MDFKEFKEKCFGKTVEDIKEVIFDIDNFWKDDIEIIKLIIDAETTSELILDFDKTSIALYLFKQKYIIQMYLLKELTNIEMIPEDEHFDDYNPFIVEAMIELNQNAFLFNNMITDILYQKQQNVLNELYVMFEKGLPDKEDLDEMKNKLDNMFSNESPENLKMIESILAYNDPNIKQIKDFIFNPKVSMSNIDKHNQEPVNTEASPTNKQEDEALMVLQETQKSANGMEQLIKSTPMVKEIDDKIKQEQIQRVLEYNKELEGKLKEQN